MGRWEEVAKKIGISPSTLSGWKSRNTLSGLNQIFESCDEEVNLHWLITGEGEPIRSSDISTVDQKFSDYEASLDDLNNTDISEDDFLEFLLKQQEAVVDFLRKLKSDRSD